MFLALSLTAGILVPPAVEAQKGNWWSLTGRSYYEPLVAGVREAHMSALALAWATPTDFLVEERRWRRVWDIDVGTELPIGGLEFGGSDGGRVFAGRWGFGLWLPIDFHMIEDFEDDSAPIINTDYRFGLALKAQRGLDSASWLGFRVFVGHESTHLGDEFSLTGKREFEATFERINVTWEFLDLGVLYENFGHSLGSAGLRGSARMGFTASLDSSYYSVDSPSKTESALGPVTTSKNRVDPYVGLDLQLEDLFGNWGPYLSLEARHRTVHDYHKAAPTDEEDRQCSFNILAGIRKTGTGGAWGRASLFLRFYHGVNPHGQFRNDGDYTQFGVGVRLIR